MLYETLEKQGCENITSAIEQMTNLTLEKQSNWFKENCVKDQDKISFSIARIKEIGEGIIDAFNKSFGELCLTDVKEIIDNQIASLKKGVE
jgi:hypothetical protein